MRVTRLACALLISAASIASAQDAVEWFGKATYTTNPDEQVYYYQQALKADPHYHQAAHNLAGVYYRKGQVRKSIALYEQIIRNAKAYHQTFYNLACCYARVGDNEHALKALERAFQKGFHDKKLVDRDEDLAEVRATPQYGVLEHKYLSGHYVPPAPALATRTKKVKKLKAPSAGALEPVAAGMILRKKK